jgi:hypothetical protein
MQFCKSISIFADLPPYTLLFSHATSALIASSPVTVICQHFLSPSQRYAPAYLPTAELYANAPADPKTGALAPEHLAKVYMWNSAAKARTTDPAQLTEINRIEGLVLQVMPATWRPDLDKRVAEHLAKYK